jgi:hypothetical protein
VARVKRRSWISIFERSCLSRLYVFVDYHVDAWSANHLARLVAAGDAAATAFASMTMDQRWLERSVETLAEGNFVRH